MPPDQAPVAPAGATAGVVLSQNLPPGLITVLALELVAAPADQAQAVGTVHVVLHHPTGGARHVVLIATQQALAVPAATRASLPGEAGIIGCEGRTCHSRTEARDGGGTHLCSDDPGEFECQVCVKP